MAENPEIHPTRLKEKLIEAIPGLTAHIKGREVLLAFEEDIGSLISRALPGENDDNALCLERAANIVREEMFNESSSATGSVTQSCQKGSVPQAFVGGAVASWLVRSTSERAVRVRALAGDIVLCSWARHFTLTVPLSTQVYKWVPANLMLGVTLRWTSIPSRGE